MRKERLKQQFAYLRKLRGMTFNELKELHAKTFDSTKYDVAIRTDAPRSVYERRLWLLYCVRHYHLHVEDPRTRRFKAFVKRQLSQEVLEFEDDLGLELRNEAKFTKRRVFHDLKPREVDRYLVALGLNVDGSIKFKRRCLWEYFNLSAQRLPQVRAWRRRAKVTEARLKNKFVLRDIIKFDPNMTWRQFQDWYGDAMPDVTQSSFHNARSWLRKHGIELPRLEPGRPRKVRGE